MSVAQFQQKLPPAELTTETEEMVPIRDAFSYNKKIE